MENFVTPSTWQTLDRTLREAAFAPQAFDLAGTASGYRHGSAKRLAAPSAGPVQGTTVSVPTARMRLATPMATLAFPITDVVATDGGSGFRTWYPPA